MYCSKYSMKMKSVLFGFHSWIADFKTEFCVIYLSKMKNYAAIALMLISGFIYSCGEVRLPEIKSAETSNKVDSFHYESATLKIQWIAHHTYLYTCYLETQSFGKVDCNGIIYINDKEAVVLDAPTTDAVSLELIHVIEQELGAKVTAVIVNHFHQDCIGGLKAFHDLNIPSHAHNSTIAILVEKGKDKDYIPKLGFESADTLWLGKEMVTSAYMGKGHTADNIVNYMPASEVLFGGCLVKSLHANKGNLEDADTLAWSATIQKVKENFTKVKWVIPGHGAYGDTSLLNYTRDLFQ